MRRSSPVCCSGSRRIALRTCRRFSAWRRSRCRSRCSGCIAIFAIARRRWLVLFGAGWLLQAICNGYYMLFFGVFVGLWMLWFASPWSRPKTFTAIAGGVGRRVAAAGAVAVAIPGDSRGFGFTREFGTIRDFGADVFGAPECCTRASFLGMAARLSDERKGSCFPA